MAWLDIDFRPLAWALIHFLWQGSLAAILLAGALQLLRRSDSRIRYAVCCVTLMLMAGLPLATLVSSEAAATPPPPTNAPVQSNPLDAALPWIVAAWGLGVLCVGVRHVSAWCGLRRWIESQTVTVGAALETRFAELVALTGIERPVRLLASAHIDVPSTVGSLRPVVLVPVALITGLPAAHLDALLVHELAHVRRWDYAVNLLQIFVETVLFYHPAVWWVSRQIRIERESCCDDVAVALCQDRRAYVEALTTLETMRGTTMAMSANGGSLLARVRRLLGEGGDGPSTGSAGALLAMMLLLASLTIAVNACDSPTQSNEKAAEADNAALLTEVDSDEPHVARFHGKDGQTFELKRPPGMTDEEFHKHLQENWTSIHEEHGLEGSAKNSFEFMRETHEKAIQKFVDQGILEKGAPFQVRVEEDAMYVNDNKLSHEEAVEFKKVLREIHQEATLELHPGWVEKE